MSTQINQLEIINSALTEKLASLENEYESIYKECEMRIKASTANFKINFLAPSLALDMNQIFIDVQAEEIRFGHISNIRYGGHRVYYRTRWGATEKVAELSWYSTTASFDKREQFNIYATELALLGFIANELNNETEFSKDFLSLCEMYSVEMTEVHAKNKEIRTIREVLADNNRKISDLKVDEFFKAGQTYTLTENRYQLVINNRREILPKTFTIEKITDKKVNIKIANLSGDVYPIQVNNYRSFIREIIKDEQKNSIKIISLVKAEEVV